jgi:putative membrane protein
VIKAFSGVIGFALLAGPAWAVDDDVDFVTRASIGNRFAITESQLALDRSGNPKVKNLAQRLVEDHNKAERELEAAVDGSGARVSVTLDADRQMQAKALQDKSGADFDRAYLDDQSENHSNLLTLYADYMLLGDDPKLKPLAVRMIPVTERQLESTQAIAGN